jgi:hypothetical protein
MKYGDDGSWPMPDEKTRRKASLQCEYRLELPSLEFDYDIEEQQAQLTNS